MQSFQSGIGHSRKVRIFTVLLVALLLTLLAAGCDNSTPTPQILVVTATFTSQPVVQVVTATFTPTPETVQIVTATFTPTPEGPAPEPTVTLDTALQKPGQAGSTAVPTPTPAKPTATLAPAEPTATLTPEPTATSTPEPTATTKPAAKAPSLKSYYVVYTTFKGPDLQDYRLWGMNGDGSGAEEILQLASEPAFSADGKQFAFYHWTDGLYVYNLPKDTLAHIVHDGNASFPTWAPKGNRIAYFVAGGQRWIWVVNADGSGLRQLTPGMRPYWSLNGGFIAYDTCENNKCGIFRINPDGGGKRLLTSDSGGGAAVSPDGRKIAYWSRADGDFEIYVINADGSGKRQLTKNKGNDALPAWSPDGQYIYYLSDQNGKAWAVMAMSSSGANARKIIGANAGNDPGRGWQYQRITVTWND